MSILKALIGGLVGAAIATVVLMILRDGSMRGYEWFPLVTGLLTGLGTRLLAGSSGRSLLTGIVAALVSMVAILMGDEVLHLVKMSSTDVSQPLERVAQKEAAAKSAAESADEEDSESGEAGADDAEGAEDGGDVAANQETDPVMARSQAEEAAARAGITSAAPLPPKKRPKTLKDFLPYIFSGLGVLIAYQLGRGTPPAKVVHEETSSTTTTETDEEAAT